MDAGKVKEMATHYAGKTYVPKQIKVETPEEAKAREAAGHPAPQMEAHGMYDEDEIKKLVE